MQSKTFIAIAFAFVCGAVAVHAQAFNSQSGDKSNARAAISEAAQMVPAEAVLAQAIDTSKTQPGEQFKAVLSDTVHLKNGMELPKGTALAGAVESQSASAGAGAQLVLRFTQADLKDGKTIPIEATIVGAAPSGSGDLSEYEGNEPQPNQWDGKVLNIDATGVLSGIDLHSRIAGENSGVFVSTGKSSVKLDARTQIALAIGAPQANG